MSTTAPSHRPSRLNFITGNANKLAEVRAILADTGVQLSSKALDLPEMQGGIEEISRDKCRRAAEAVGGAVLVEDTCLSFDAFNELPGPYIKYFLTELGPDGLHKLLAAFDNKAAQAICTFAYCEGPGKEAVVFQGRTKGKIVPARGPRDFGWDAAFEPLEQPSLATSSSPAEAQPQTYAEMAKTDKNKISHRGKALEKLKEWLKGGDVEVL